MRETSLRWGTTIGGAGAVLGVLSYLAGAVLAPVNTARLNGDAAITRVFIHVLLVLAVLGVVLGLCYYAGMRIARDQLDASGGDPSATSPDRTSAALGGAVVMLVYWFVVTLYQYLFPPFGQRDTSLQALEGHVILGVVFIVMGAGLGSMGARTAASRRLITRVIVAPPPRPATTPTTLPDGVSLAPRAGPATRQDPDPAAPPAE